MKFSILKSLCFFSVGLGALSFVSCDSPELTANASGPSGVAAQKIKFGVYTADKASAVVEEFAPILDDLEKAISDKLARPVKIELDVFSKYEEGVAAIADGRVHFSRLGPASYITAKEMNPELELLAMESKKGSRVFHGVIAIHRDCEITTLAELKGKSFAFGNQLSTIGCYLSQAELLKAGLKGTDLEKFEFLDRHDIVGMAVVAGDFTAGALKDSTFKDLVDQGQPIKALMEFENVTKPWVVHPSLDREVLDALRSTLLEMKTSSVSKDGFLPASDSDYESIRVAMAIAQNF
jgi:phosphonate transport system substrate-binding protein